MEYKIINWDGKKDFKLKIKLTLIEYLEFGERYNQELKLNLKKQIKK